MDGDVESGIFNISLADSDDTGSEPDSGKAVAVSWADKHAQSEEEFQHIRREYRPKVENGEIWKTINLPLSEPISKPQAQALLHAAEELYFFRRYKEALDFIRSVFGEQGKLDGQAADTAELLRDYESRCQKKMKLLGGNERRQSRIEVAHPLTSVGGSGSIGMCDDVKEESRVS